MNKKRLLGLSAGQSSFMRRYNSGRKADRYDKVTDPAIWDNKEWFVEMCEKRGLGKLAIARIIGKTTYLVYRRINRYGINISNHIHRSDNPCCNKEWLIYHYCTKDDYHAWCIDDNTTPDPNGGMGMPINQLAEMAEVSEYTIINWLVKFSIYIRNGSESLVISNNYAKLEKNSMETRAP